MKAMSLIILGAIKITNVSGESVVNFGDVLCISPKSANKSISGAGGGNTGDFLQTNTINSVTNIISKR
jgi:spore germination protein PF